MALPLANTFETGLADETALTAANSDDGTAGNAFDVVTLAGTGTIKFDTAQAAHGSLSARFDPQDEFVSRVEWNSASVGSVTDIYGRIYVYKTAQPTEPLWIVLPNNTGSFNALVQWRSAAFFIFDGPTANFTNTAAAPPLSQWVRLEWHMVCSQTVGSFEFKYFLGDNVSPVETIGLTNVDTGSSTNSCWLGSVEPGQTVGPFWMDDCKLLTGAYAGPAQLPVEKQSFYTSRRRSWR